MKFVVLNHKMNLYYEELDEYIERVNKIDRELIIAPSNIYLLEFVKRCHKVIASQDLCYSTDGNHTGKVSLGQIKSLGVKYSIIGHSEKNDSLDSINAKLKICLENDITPILCFGNKDKQDDVIKGLINIGTYDERIIYAYEPLYNIANDGIDYLDIKENVDKIYNHLEMMGINEPKIIYGGGIREDNINEIYQIDKIKGILIGSKSSNIKEIEQLLLKIDEK